VKVGDKLQSQSKYFYGYYTIKKYNDNYYKMIIFKYPVRNSGFEIERNYESECTYEFIDDDERFNSSISRSRSKVFEYAICNEFDYFVTLTLDPKKYNRYDLDGFIKDLGQFIRNYRRVHGLDIQYLLIPERHSDGAWHMHGLMKGIPEEYLHINGNGYLDWKAYKDRFGWISLDKVRNKEAVSKYITKYITKEQFGKSMNEKHKKLYYVTRGLKQAEVIEKGTLTSAERVPEGEVFENDYVRIITYKKYDVKEA